MSDHTVASQGTTLHLKGAPAEEGDRFPNVRLAADPGEDVAFEDREDDRVHIVTSALSVDTPVCAQQFRTFDERAADLQDEGIQVWYVTRDLPFALERFADEHDLGNLTFLSDYKYGEFGEKTGLAVDETELLARATFVVDTNGEVVYREVLDDIADEPDYDAAIQAARRAAE